ncbi:MAG: hypothetical protein ACRDJX_10265 [Solirubrobacteraceae bacterium]
MRLQMGSSRALAAVLGVLAALLVGCGSSTKLIPTADAGPLQSDFEAVARAAETGDGNCAATEAAIARTEGDFSTLPASVDSGLRETIRNGIDDLRSHALALCAQPLARTTSTNTTAKTTTSAPPPAAPTPTTTTNTQTTQTATGNTPPETATSEAGGGTAAPGTGEAPVAPGGGTGVGEAAPGTAEAPSVPGQEPVR